MLWCHCALGHHYFCTTKIPLQKMVQFLIPLAKNTCFYEGIYKILKIDGEIILLLAAIT